jgi:hypothetical protein
MALHIKVNEDDLLAACGIAEEKVLAMKTNGLSLMVGPASIKVLDAHGGVMASSPVTSDALGSVVQNKAPKPIVHLVTKMLNQLIDASVTKAGVDLVSQAVDETADEIEAEVAAEEGAAKVPPWMGGGTFVQKKKAKPPATPATPATPADAVAMLAAVFEHHGVDLVSEGSGPKVKLVHATKMYQPVFGTSVGSTYFAVALSPLIKVAARYKGTSLSVRLEGDVETIKIKAVELGFKLDAAHASIHMIVDSDMTAGKVLGSILCGLSMAFNTPIPVPAHIHNKWA